MVEREVVHKIARSLSGLLDRRQLPAWHDVTDATLRKTTLQRLIGVAEEMANVVTQMSSGMKRDVLDEDDDDVRMSKEGKTFSKNDENLEPTYIVTPNICKIFKSFYYRDNFRLSDDFLFLFLCFYLQKKTGKRQFHL